MTRNVAGCLSAVISIFPATVPTEPATGAAPWAAVAAGGRPEPMT